MSLVTLGISGLSGRDAAAALFIDGELVAAIEEERMLRRKGAKDVLPYLAARQCLQMAGIAPAKVNRLAIPYSPISLFSKARWHYAYRHWYAPDRSVDSIFNGNRRFRRYQKQIKELIDKLHIPLADIKIIPVKHQLAHSASCYHMVDMTQKTAIVSIDATGEYSSMFLGYGDNGKIHTRKEYYNPDSLSGMYEAMADYLGFDNVTGEFKVMGMSPFGDPEKYDLSSLSSLKGRRFKVNNTLIGTVGLRRYKNKSKGHFFSQKLIDLLGPPRVGNLVDDPYIHYGAAMQKMYEDITATLVNEYLGDVIKETGRLAVTGTGSMNVLLNKRLRSLPNVKQLIVHPACGDAGAAIGAAAIAVHRENQAIHSMSSIYLGSSFNQDDCIQACKGHREKPEWEVLDDPCKKAADLLAQGELVAWFQGKMEFGPRALGNRSILANPASENIGDKINNEVKFRERWRPFSVSLLDSFAEEFFLEEDQHNAFDEFMCVGATVQPRWATSYPNIMYKDGCTRAQVVKEKVNPRFYELLTNFSQLTGHKLLINTALSRPGESLARTPDDALNMFHGSDLKYLIMEGVMVTKRKQSEDW